MNLISTCLCSLTLLLIFCGIRTATEIRGLEPTKLSLYTRGVSFQCLDGSQTMPADHVNDDYCDCSDGTDEPGTSACPNGSFYCINREYRSHKIPSSHVNDGICDCCDGSDEYDGRVECTNTCVNLGRLLREEEHRRHQLLKQGHELYKEYAQLGVAAVAEKRTRLTDLEKERDEVDVQKAEYERVKKSLEEPETLAKDKFKEQWEAEKAKRKAEKKAQDGREAFAELDLNHDNMVSVSELQMHKEFDIDANGEVSEDEAKEYLEESDAVDIDLFMDKVWESIHQIYIRNKPAGEEGSEQEGGEGGRKEEELAVEDEDEERHRDEEDDDDDDDRDDDDDFKKNEKPSYIKKQDGADDEQMPEYDEETRKLIDAADAARTQFNQVDEKFRNIETEISNIKQVLDADLGMQYEFYPLREKCFDYTDREYTYSLCPFNKAVQRNKNGGGETSLGRWGEWSGQADYKYSKMTYDHGQNCWNGPDRSAKVHIECGITNELVSVSEPNRCEYRFIFHSPAACSQPVPESALHDEL